MDRQAAIDLIRNSALSEHTSALSQQLEPAVFLMPRRVESAALPLGASRFGGLPDVPANGFTWPTWTLKPLSRPNPRKPGKFISGGTPQRRVMHFLAQIRLDDLPESPVRELLPDHGTLSFFFDAIHASADPREGIGWRVLFDDTPADELTRLKICPAPRDEPPFRLCALELRAGISAWNDLPIRNGDEDDFAAWQELIDEIEETSPDAAKHHLRGGMRALQEGAREHCVLASRGLTFDDLKKIKSAQQVRELKHEEADWVLLLQLDSDELPGFLWADMGRLFFMIHVQDLAARDFDRVWCVLDSH